MKRIIVLVSNDLEHDQRVARVCGTLLELGFSVTLVGRMLPWSVPIQRPYEVRRFRLLFRRGAMFYAALNLRLFFFLLFRRTDVILANDLDTLMPAFLISKISGCKLVYDSHEYFTEAEGLTGRSFQKNAWLSIERWIFPKLTHVYTVNESIASIYRKQYGVDVKVVRNIPLLKDGLVGRDRAALGLPADRRIVILQGAYIDPDRGGIEAVEAMRFLDDVLLLVIGSGRDMDNLKQRCHEFQLDDKIRFYGRMPFEELRHYTAQADLGLSLDKPLHLNYKYSLPNKLFDYIHAGTPVLASDLPEPRRIIEQYGVGWICENMKPEALAGCIRDALESPDFEKRKHNCISARQQLNWQCEEEVLRTIYSGI